MTLQKKFINAASVFLFATVAAADKRTIRACSGQACDNCPRYTEVTEGYPACLIYNSNDSLGGPYAADNGHGYDVWWNSEAENPGCSIVVRTPASQDISNCGYFLRSWDGPGCYYTRILSSFMIQFCCGEGDCDAAEPASTLADARAKMLQGGTSVVSLKFQTDDGDGVAESGTRDLGDGISMSWAKRGPSSGSQLAARKAQEARDVAANAEARRITALGGHGQRPKNVLQKRGECDKYTESRHYTKAGRQVKVSPTQTCNSDDSCDITVQSSVTTGRTVSVSAGFDLFELFSASIDMSFTKEKTRSISTTFSQVAGTTGYVTFTPTYDCTFGSVDDCNDAGINNGDEVEGCTPRVLQGQDGETVDGTYSFVYGG